MRYTNPPPAPLIPPSGEFKTSLRLVTTVLTFAALLVLFIGGIATWLAPKLPFSVEKTLAGEWATSLLGGNPTVDQEEIETALQTLIDSLRGEGRVVTEIPIQAHYLDKPTINAMATLGGHIFVYRGIIEHCDSEDALAAVLAHEIAHVEQRHVAKAMSRQLAILGTFSLLGLHNNSLTTMIIGKGEELHLLDYSRDAERAADSAALTALSRRYGHAAGLFDLMSMLSRQETAGLELTRTHPLSRNRLATLLQLADEKGIAIDGPRHPFQGILARIAAKDH